MIALAIGLALAAALAATTLRRLLALLGQQPPPVRGRGDEPPLRLRQVADILNESAKSEFSVDRSLRPLLLPIVGARLGRQGVDIGLAPERARELLGERLWQIVGPDRTPPGDRVGHGLSGPELRAMIERLEQL